MGCSEVKNRKIYIDFLKIIAIYMVLFNHTETNGFVLFTVARGSRLYWLYLFNAIFITIAVPLFFMTSGALLLGKEESFKKLLTKRFLKKASVLFVGSLVAYLYTCLRVQPQTMSVTSFLKKLYTENLTPAYWYLYTYLAYILMLPLLRKLAKAMTDKEYKWMVLMYGLIQSLSIIDYLKWQGTVTYNGNFSFFITTIDIFFPLMGYYIDQRMKKEQFTKKNLIILTVISIAAIIICCFMTHYKCTLIGEWKESSCQTFFGTLIFLPAITVYYATKMWFMNHSLSNRVNKIISTAGCITFGIYLIEQICREETKQIFIWLVPYVPKLLACWIWIFVACLMGGAITLLLKKIPYIKKFI